MTAPVTSPHATDESSATAAAAAPTAATLSAEATTTHATAVATATTSTHTTPLHLTTVQLATALALRVLRRKRFWALVIVLAAMWQAHAHEQDIRDALPSSPIGMMVEEHGRPGQVFFNRSATGRDRARAQRPVVLVPGFVTTGLEVWESRPCFRSEYSTNFRQRIFGPGTLLKLLTDPQCFLDHIALDPEDAGDPEGIKVRHDVGFDSVDYIFANFWVWAKMMKNLADIGYEPRNLWTASFDWRLDPETAETRHAFFSRLRRRVEDMYHTSDLVTSSSVSSPSPAFVAECSPSPSSAECSHAPRKKRRAAAQQQQWQPKQKVVLVGHSYGNVMIAAFLRWADERDPGWTDRYVHAFVNIAGPLLGIPKANAALTSGEVKDSAMLPSVTRRVLDSHVLRRSRAAVFRSWPCLASMMTRGPEAAFPDVVRWTSNQTALSMTASVELVRNIAAAAGNSLLVSNIDAMRAERNTAPQLPVAPQLQVFCIYGVGQPTEVGYYFKESADPADLEEIAFDFDTTDGEAVAFGEGDGTVPLASLGYVCRSPRQWPSRAGRVVTVELSHQPQPIYIDPRGGVASSDHVDIMGSYAVIELVLKVASGFDDEVQDSIISGIDALSEVLDRGEVA